MNKILGVLLIILGIKVLFIQNFSGNWSSYNFSDFFIYIPVSFLLFYVGYLSLKYKPPKKQFSICPNCKEAFTYSELENGKCKYCEDVDTIDLEEYYKEDKEKSTP